MRQRRQQKPFKSQVNVRMESDQKEYLDQWAQALYWETGALCRLLVAEKIVEHSTRTGASLPQSLIDDPPRLQATGIQVMLPPAPPSRSRKHDAPRLRATAPAPGSSRPPAPPARKRV